MLDVTQILDGTLGPTAGAAITVTRVSTNVIDWLTGRDMGAGDILGVHVDILQTFTAGGAATLTVDAEVCDTVGGTYLNILTTPAIPVAQLIAGSSIFRYSFPINQVLNAVAGVLKAPGRFFRLNYTVATGPMTAGTVMAYLTPTLDRDVYYTYPSNYTAATAAGELA
jgi:hypothetical protein